MHSNLNTDKPIFIEDKTLLLKHTRKRMLFISNAADTELYYPYKVYWISKDGHEDVCVYAGAGKLTEIVTMSAFKNLMAFREDSLHRIEVEPEGYPLLYQAKNAINKMTGMEVFAYNVEKGMSFRNAVMCINTGRVYANASTACRCLDIQTGWMSRHLNGKSGCGSIRGMKFKMVGRHELPEGTEIIR